MEPGIKPVLLQDPVLQKGAFPKINSFRPMTSGSFSQKKETTTTTRPPKPSFSVFVLIDTSAKKAQGHHQAAQCDGAERH